MGIVQAATERDQNERVQGVAASLRGLQEKLKMQEETKTSSEARAQQLATFVQELRKQTECLHIHVRERDMQLTVLRTENENAFKIMTKAKASEEAACARWAFYQVGKPRWSVDENNRSMFPGWKR